MVIRAASAVARPYWSATARPERDPPPTAATIVVVTRCLGFGLTLGRPEDEPDHPDGRDLQDDCQEQDWPRLRHRASVTDT